MFSERKNTKGSAKNWKLYEKICFAHEWKLYLHLYKSSISFYAIQWNIMKYFNKINRGHGFKERILSIENLIHINSTIRFPYYHNC